MEYLCYKSQKEELQSRPRRRAHLPNRRFTPFTCGLGMALELHYWSP